MAIDECPDWQQEESSSPFSQELQLLVTTNIISFLVGWIMCSEFGYISKIAKVSYLFLKGSRTSPSYITVYDKDSSYNKRKKRRVLNVKLQEDDGRSECDFPSEGNTTSCQDHEPSEKSPELNSPLPSAPSEPDQKECIPGEVENIFDEVFRKYSLKNISSNITEKAAEEPLKSLSEESIDVSLEEQEILNIGISKKPSTDIGGFFKFTGTNYVRESEINEREEAFEKSKLTPEENRKLTDFWDKKVKGMRLGYAEKLIRKYGYIPHVYRINDGIDCQSTCYDPTKVNLHIKSSTKCLLMPLTPGTSSAYDYIYQVEGMGGI